jgi:phosphohistidine phosphatase SixA
MTSSRSLALGLTVLLAVSSAPVQAQAPVTTVILVRHGEKSTEPGADPALSASGEARARALAVALQGTKVAAVFTTPFKRTNATAAPLAGANGIMPIEMPVSGGAPAYAKAVADSIAAHYAGRTVVVIGHSNTIPALIAALGGPRMSDLCDNEYSTMLRVTLDGSSTPKVVASRYGAPDPPGNGGCQVMSTPGNATPGHSSPASGMTDSAAVQRAVLDYVEGFYEGDSAKFVRSVRPDVFKYGFWRPRDSTSYQGEQMKFAEFNSYANRVKKSGHVAPATTRKDVTLYDVQDHTASAKLTAYWGTDYLLLGKFGNTWMVTSVLWQSPPR